MLEKDEDIANVVLSQMETMLLGHTHGVWINSLTRNVGRALYRRYFIEAHSGAVADELERIYSRSVFGFRVGVGVGFRGRVLGARVLGAWELDSLGR